MPQIRRRIITHVKTPKLPEWTAQYILLWQFACRSGLIQRWESAIRLERLSGYSSLDLLAFILAYFCSGKRSGIKSFAAQTRPCGHLLAAIADRKRWPTQASISRMLSSVTESQALAATKLLLGECMDSIALIQHESTVYRDNAGNACHAFHFDHTITTLRQRALPEGADMPPARRHSAQVAQRGYSGRKRGDVQFSRGTLQHSGNSQWLHMTLAKGNGDLTGDLAKAYEAIEGFCFKYNLQPEQCILMTDGVGQGWTQVRSGCTSKAHFLTRYGESRLLLNPNVASYLATADWQRVEDSGAGVKRYATELGTVFRDEGWHARVVVSRFKSEDGRKHGAGKVLNGWQYEFYATDLERSAFGAPEVVTLYYGRSAQENRFAQEDRELGLDHVFSYHLPAQWLVSAIGLWTYNKRILGGVVAIGGLCSLSDKPTLRVTESIKLPGYESDLVETQEMIASDTGVETIESEESQEDSDKSREAISVDSSSKEMTQHEHETMSQLLVKGSSRRSERVRRMVKQLNWNEKLSKTPEWRWDRECVELICPAMKRLPLHDVKMEGKSSIMLRFRGRYGDCSRCPLRKQCSKSVANRFRHERGFSVSFDEIEFNACTADASREVADFPPRTEVERANTQRTIAERGTHWKAPVEQVMMGQRALSHPQLRPTVLRQTFDKLCDAVEVQLIVSMMPEIKIPDYLATSPARRQNRRHTWHERLSWNALPDTALVDMTFMGPETLKRFAPYVQMNSTA